MPSRKPKSAQVFPHSNDPPTNENSNTNSNVPILSNNSLVNTKNVFTDRLHNCGHCNQFVQVDGLLCFICSRWYHLSCCSISKEFYDSLSSVEESFEFFCNSCKKLKDEIMSRVKSDFFTECLVQNSNVNVFEVINELKNDISSLRASVECIPKEKSNVVGEIKKMTTEVTASINSLPKSVDPKPLSYAKVISMKNKNQPSSAQSSSDVSSLNLHSGNFLFVRGISSFSLRLNAN